MWCPICNAYTPDTVLGGANGFRLICQNERQGSVCEYSISVTNKQIDLTSYAIARRAVANGKVHAVPVLEEKR